MNFVYMFAAFGFLLFQKQRTFYFFFFRLYSVESLAFRRPGLTLSTSKGQGPECSFNQINKRYYLSLIVEIP